MRPSARCLKALESTHLRRLKSTSFIGLGRMGHEMASNLFSKQLAQDAEAQFVICDAVPDRSHAFAEKFLGQFPGAKLTVAKTPDAAALASQTIITMLPSPQVKTVYAEGILPVLRELPPEQARSTLCIDSTTLDVFVAKQVAADVISTGAEMVDAPVLGGVTGAKAGTLSFLVGGSEASYWRSASILSLMGQRVIYCGVSGTGIVANICHDMVLGVQQMSISAEDAMLVGQHFGLEPLILAGIISSSTGGSEDAGLL